MMKLPVLIVSKLLLLLEFIFAFIILLKKRDREKVENYYAA